MIENLNIQFLIGQAIGIVAFSISAAKYFRKKKKDIVKLTMYSSFFYIIHYFLIGAIAGSYTLFVAIARDYYIYLRETHHKKHRHRKIYNNAFVFIALFAVYTSLIILSISQPINTLPLIAGVSYLCFEWFTTNKTTLKKAAGLTTLPWLVFDVLSFSIAGILTDIISLIACITGVLKDKKLRRHVVKNNH